MGTSRKDNSRLRHLLKTISWRILATTDTFIIAWLITGKVDWAAGIATVEVATKMILYYFHERAWYKYIRIGRDNKHVKSGTN